MNVFVLCTGRCGSTTFSKAAAHMTNFTAGHETRCSLIGNHRLAYPPSHIEVDNRLSWFLGRLDSTYGKNAYYVHLQRDILKTAESFCDRWNFGIMQAYRIGILMGNPKLQEATDEKTKFSVAFDYCCTVNENIRCFLKDKPNCMTFRLENAANDRERFWNWIGAKGDFAASLGEWSINYNARKTAPVA